jgi:sortase A
MRLVVEKEPVRQILKVTQFALFACAVLLLGYCGFALADAWTFQRRESRDLDRHLRDQRAVSEGTLRPNSSASPKGAPGTATDRLIGRMEIPRLFLSVVVVDGIDKTTLRRAVGHIPGTAMPGQAGNVGVAGHRDTFFRGLKDLRTKDEIQFSTLRGDFKYVVQSLSVVEPNNIGILAPSNENVLTIVTCYPFSYVGAAPKRFVVRAMQVSSQTPARPIVE